MTSLGSRSTLHSPYNVRGWSTDSGLDRNFIIVPNPDDNVFGIDEPAMAATGMGPTAATAQAPTKDIAAHTDAVVDWVHQQSDHEQLRNAAIVSRRAQMITPPPFDIQGINRRAERERNRMSGTAGRPVKRVYDIATLLKLRETQCAVPVMLRVKPEAISENIFQYMGASQTHRIPTRSHGLSDVSNLSRGETSHNNNASYSGAGSGSFGHKIRQPTAPPQNSALQQHDGFVRFLKQHASPPHHRVTAGGRIVPTGPSSPPPMLDFGSLNGIIGDRQTAARLPQREGHLNLSMPRLQGMQSQPHTPLAPGAYPSGQGHTTIPQPVLASSVPAVLPYNNVVSGLVSPMPQITAAMVPTAMFPDGSTLISYGGISYRASWNGVTMIMEPLQTLPLAADQHLHATGHVQAQVSNPLLRASQLLQAPTTSTQLASSNNGSQHRAENSNGLVTSQAAGNSEGDFKAQLTNLDRYLALYHYDITSAERAAYVTKRRYLVEEIDKIRVSKEQPKRVIPIIEPITRAHVTAEAQHGPKFQAKQVVPSSMHSAGQKLVSAKDAMNNKALSAAAPAFVPRSQESGPSSSPNLLATGQHSKQFARLEVSEPRLRNHAAFNLKDVTNAAISRKDRALHAYDMSTKDTSHRHASSSSVLDLSDPAMRIIDYEDIEYASRYLYNWTQDTKTYCTTVAEFQEAIRRVREQACMYGCEGGQSKDPAYDAEQDIWWAICDRDPIPLPSIVPDHVANPRPWNWNDSAFNYRRKGSPWPGPECDKARNSPRLAGWDPIVTEAMKDKMDVSRSYFALKGQLSSVPFRDFAYDRHGNKVMTESGTASDVPDIEAPSDSSDRDASFATEGGNGPQNAPQANNRALRNMSTNDLNGRHTAPKKTTRNKSSRKKNITDGDAIKPSSQSAMRTPQHKPIQSKIKANLAIDGIISASNSRDSDVQIKSICKNPQPNRPPHQAYVEECLETPATRHMRADSKGSPTAQSRILSRTWSNQKGLDASAKNDQSIITPDPTTKEEHIPYSTPGWVTEPTNVNDPWYGPPTDPVTLDYLARLKTWCPGDPDVLETMAAEQEKRAEDETAEAFQKAINQSVYGIDDSRHNSTWDTHDVSAETRSPWGPEQDSPFFEPCQRFKRPDSQLPADSFEAGKIAKVKIPNATYNRVLFAGENPMQPLHAGIAGHSALETQAIKPTKVDSLKNDSHHFLRKMLKNPTFSSTQAFRFPTRMSSKLANTSRTEETAHTASTENMASGGAAKLGLIGKEPPSKGVPSSSVSAFKSAPKASLSKAQSSLASSLYQAHGYLPQFGGAGKAYAASLYGERSDQGLPSPARVRLPPYVSYEEKQTTLAPSSYQTYQGTNVHSLSSNHHTPVNFGFDGGADSPPVKKGIANSSNNARFDYKGVTAADYEIQRPDPDSAWHQGEVEDFFQELAKDEESEIVPHRQVNTQSAA